MAKKKADASVLMDLYAVIEQRRGADPKTSYTARLFKKGRRKIAQKVGEEATETVIAGVAQDRQALVRESADLLYHLMVLWAQREVRPEEVFEELRSRRVEKEL